MRIFIVRIDGNLKGLNQVLFFEIKGKFQGKFAMETK